MRRNKVAATGVSSVEAKTSEGQAGVGTRIQEHVAGNDRLQGWATGSDDGAAEMSENPTR